MHFIEEASDTALVEQIYSADRTVSLFGNNEFGNALGIGVLWVVVFVAVNKYNRIGVLFDRA